MCRKQMWGKPSSSWQGLQVAHQRQERNWDPAYSKHLEVPQWCSHRQKQSTTVTFTYLLHVVVKQINALITWGLLYFGANALLLDWQGCTAFACAEGQEMIQIFESCLCWVMNWKDWSKLPNLSLSQIMRPYCSCRCCAMSPEYIWPEKAGAVNAKENPQLNEIGDLFRFYFYDSLSICFPFSFHFVPRHHGGWKRTLHH